jgi:ABC-type uncharacterized transport system, permease component
MTNNTHEPLLHISKREECSFVKRCFIRVAAILLALVVCGFFINSITGMNPVLVYKAFFDGALGSTRRMWVTIRDTLVLLLVAVGLAPAFKMRFWNIGAEGQTLIGGLTSAAVMISFADKIPNGLLVPVMMLASMLGGCVWGLIPALFKAKWNTNETLFTLMMNYIASQLVTFCIVFWENPKGSNTVGIINQSTKAGWLPQLFGLQYGWNVVIVAVLTVFMYVYLRYSKQGYEVSYVGQSLNTARYAGISVKDVIIRTMAISGAVCGLAGFLLVSGAGHTISVNIVGGRGFTAIIVAWLSKLNTFTMTLVSFFLTFMEKGAAQTASQFSLSENASDIITGILLFFILGCEFFINFKVERRHKKEVRA